MARNLSVCYTAVPCVVTQRSSPQTTAENLTCFSIFKKSVNHVEWQRKEHLWRSRQKSFEQRPKTIYREIRETWNQPVRIRCMLTIFPSTSRYLSFIPEQLHSLYISEVDIWIVFPSPLSLEAKDKASGMNEFFSREQNLKTKTKKQNKC